MAAVGGGGALTASFLLSKPPHCHLLFRRRNPLTAESCSSRKQQQHELLVAKGRRGQRIIMSLKASCFVSSNSFAAAAGGRGGAGVLERPTFDQSQYDPSSQVLEGGDIGRLRDKRGIGSGDSYRVLLIDDIRHTENLVTKVIPQVVPSVTPDDARRLYQESRENSFAVVIVTVKEHAEFYSQMMIRGGLRSSIEPDSNTV